MKTEKLPSIQPIQETPRTAEDFIQLGWRTYVNKDYSQAASSFQEAVRLDGRQVDGHYGLGLSMRSLGKTNESVEALKMALELVSDESTIIDSARRTILRQLIETQILLLTENG